MSEKNLELDGAAPESRAEAQKAWKSYPPEAYSSAVADLVHFSSKTVNSNAALVGIRLSPDETLDAPYVAARTLLARGVSLALDYGRGGAAVAGICKQINAVLHNEAFAGQASPEERTAIDEAMKKAKASAFQVGTDYVDHRLRQILIPREDAEGGYVSLTPITAGGVCELLFDKNNGLVTRHNAAYEEERKKSGKDDPSAENRKRTVEPAKETSEESSADRDKGENTEKLSVRKRKLRQARFGIGGSNPQNVGGLVRAMQEPLFLDAPHGSNTVRTAYFLYYKGISLDFSRSGVLRSALIVYADFRKRWELDREVSSSAVSGRTHLKAREEEERVVGAIAEAVLQLAEKNRTLLQEHADILPQETNPETGLRALVSPHLRPAALRGLLDPSLRDGAWPQTMARLVSDRMEQAVYFNGNHVLVLDMTAKAKVRNILEEAFR